MFKDHAAQWSGIEREKQSLRSTSVLGGATYRGSLETELCSVERGSKDEFWREYLISTTLLLR